MTREDALWSLVERLRAAVPADAAISTSDRSGALEDVIRAELEAAVPCTCHGLPAATIVMPDGTKQTCACPCHVPAVVEPQPLPA